MSNAKGTALITGASTGIGAVYADRLAKRGYDLILVARDEQRLTALAQRLKADTGRKVEVLPADLTSKSDLAKVAKRLREDKAISLLLNNAGMGYNGSLAEANLDLTDKLIDLNITAVTHLASAAAANFSAQRSGIIINVSSVLALAPEISSAVYCASKAYVLNLSLTLNSELSNAGVRVQAVLPGATRTEIWERAGIDVNKYPPEMIMDVEPMVDASLAGLDLGELVTIPSLPNAKDWEDINAARLALRPHLSLSEPAQRYNTERAGA
ncbi:MAG TPA: SDR family oxidoreductase [Hyphomicrobium sp.]|nr:SDR family oxidoreductase [Hyphomicrobium sp.]